VILFAEHPAFEGHDPGSGHPEAPARLAALRQGLATAGLEGALRRFDPRRATRGELARVHDEGYVARLEQVCLAGGGQLDPDTAVGEASFDAALRAAGAGLEAAERLRRGEADAAFLALRPPGHHALAGRAMGFCLLNNVAVTAAALAAGGERVLIVDWDAHHGNGTQAAFYDRGEVCYVSLHQSPLYPGTGRLEEVGAGAGTGATANVPLPPRSSGDAYRRAVDEVVVPLAERFRPDWLLVSAGYDAHRADPLTDLGLSAGDFADLTERVLPLAAPGRRIFFLEGGYDLAALAASAAATVAVLAGTSYRPEPATGGSPADEPARRVIAAAAALHGHRDAP